MNTLSAIEIEQIKQDLMPKKFGRRGVIWTIALLLICGIGIFAYYRQLSRGLVVTNMGDYVSWGIYISNFVFFVAISLVGSLITAILRLLNVHWATPLTRIAEIIAVAAVFFAALIIVVDMGRPERIFNVFIYGRIQSPIMWDVVVITT
ncbi:MAG TPA: NrfD/PsrC family molybdoenzyme membrane anchor subunit, partial [Chitinophagaceae bacterium]